MVAQRKPSRQKARPPETGDTPPPNTAIARRESNVPATSAGVRAARLLQAFFEKRSDLTVRNYRVDLVHFSRWWCSGGARVDDRRKGRRRLDLDEVKVPEAPDERDQFVADVLRQFHGLEQLEALAVVLAYQNDLRSGALGRTFAPQTINHRITAIRSVTEMAKLLGMCSFDLSSVSLDEPSRSRITDGCGADGFECLVQYADEIFQRATTPRQRLRASRDAVIMHLMHDAGLRRFEVVQPLWPADVDLDGKRLRFRGKKRPAKEWFTCLNDDVLTSIRRYLVYRGTKDGYLFYGETPDEMMDVSTVNRMITKLAQGAGVDVTPHGLRHTAATTLLDETNGNVRAVAAFLRHKGTATVQIYDDDRQKLPLQMSEMIGRTRRRKS